MDTWQILELVGTLIGFFGVFFIYRSRKAEGTKKKRVLGGCGVLGISFTLCLWSIASKMNGTNYVKVRSYHDSGFDASYVLFIGIATALISSAYIYFESREMEEEDKT